MYHNLDRVFLTVVNKVNGLVMLRNPIYGHLHLTIHGVRLHNGDVVETAVSMGVYISTATREMRDYREAAIRAIRDAGMEPVYLNEGFHAITRLDSHSA